VIVGPGAANNFHAKVINPCLPRNGSAVGRDYITTVDLPFSAGRPWNFGVDTMVLESPTTVLPENQRVARTARTAHIGVHCADSIIA
jgi:hypothetical protein